MAGSPPTGGFCTGLADVSGAAEASETVAISSGGLATSGITSRWWRVGYHVVHHIVDPSTGLPPPPAWRTITVAAASCVDANAASTAAMVKGLGGRDWLAARNLPARLIGLDGTVVRVGGRPIRRVGARSGRARPMTVILAAVVHNGTALWYLTRATLVWSPWSSCRPPWSSASSPRWVGRRPGGRDSSPKRCTAISRCSASC